MYAGLSWLSFLGWCEVGCDSTSTLRLELFQALAFESSFRCTYVHYYPVLSYFLDIIGSSSVILVLKCFVSKYICKAYLEGLKAFGLFLGRKTHGWCGFGSYITIRNLV